MGEIFWDVVPYVTVAVVVVGSWWRYQSGRELKI